MLAIKQKHSIKLPHLLALWPKKLQFSGSSPDDDELIEAISDSQVDHDDDWQLIEQPDTERLEQYWDRVEDDIQHDPKWINFSQEES